MNKEYFGVYKGVVCNIKDPEKRGRIKVTCPEVLGATVESAWCDPLVPIAYDNGGDFCLPAKNEMVWLQFIAGDANKPVYLGGWWQEKMTPLGNTYTKLDNTRIISYKDFSIVIHKNEVTISNNKGSNKIKMSDSGILIESDKDITIKGKTINLN